MLRTRGAVFLAFLALLGGLLAVYVPKGFALRDSAAAYVATNVPILGFWIGPANAPDGSSP